MQHKTPKLTLPAIPLPEFTERQKAQWWRQHCVCMTREQLADAISYAVDSIWVYEMEETTRMPRAWQRYKNACELFHFHNFGMVEEPFNWGIPVGAKYDGVKTSRPR